MRLINADKVKAESREHCKTCVLNGTKHCDKTCVINLICDRLDLQPTVKTYETFSYEKGFQDGKYGAEMERLLGKQAEKAMSIIDRLYIEGHISNTEQGILRRAILLPEEGGAE